MSAVGVPLALAAAALVLTPVAAAVPLAWLGPEAHGPLRVVRRVGGLALVLAALGLMLPEALAGASPGLVAAAVAVGGFGFLGVSRLLHETTGHGGREIVGILGASALHKAIDGTLLGVAATLGPEAVTAALAALVLHELPHELGTYALLLSTGAGRVRALVWKILAGLAALPGMAIGLGAGAAVAEGAVPVLLALSAGAFVFVGGTAVLSAPPAPRVQRR